jgi:transposase
MKKLRYATRNQVEMQIMSLDQMLASDHLAREIWAYVEKMDVTRLLEEVDSVDGEAGAPAFDPRTLLCLWLYATVESVGSARRLAQLIEESLPYRWIAGGEAINYHTLSDFRTRHGETLDELLTASVALLAEEGRVDLENMTVAHDGMRVRASAGRDSMHRRPTLEKALALAREHVGHLKEQEGQASEKDADRRQRAACERAARERVERLDQALAVMKKLEENKRVRSDRKPREPRVSSTDPEAAMLRMANGGKDPAHNLQFTTEVQTRIITAVTVAGGSSDTGMLLPAMENFKRAHGRLPRSVLTDRGFFKYADIESLEGSRVKVLAIGLWHALTHNILRTLALRRQPRVSHP